MSENVPQPALTGHDFPLLSTGEVALKHAKLVGNVGKTTTSVYTLVDILAAEL